MFIIVIILGDLNVTPKALGSCALPQSKVSTAYLRLECDEKSTPRCWLKFVEVSSKFGQTI